MASNEGFVYIVTGETFLNEALDSAVRLREVHPDANIAFISDRDPDSEVVDEFVPIEDPAHSHRDKVANIGRTPYEKTVFLDSDTYVCSDISDLFTVLDEFDFAASHDSGRRRELYVDDEVTVNAPETFPMVNSGVMAFRNTAAVRELFETWAEIYDRHQHHVDGVVNQPSLREALYRTDVPMTVLPPEYNCRTPFPPHIRGEVRLLHGRDEEPARVQAEINSFDGDIRRTFYVVNMGDESKVRVRPEKWPKRLDLLWMSFKHRGVTTTLRKLLDWGRGGEFD